MEGRQPDDENISRTVEERLAASEVLLRQIAEIVGVGAVHANDPDKAWRSERPLILHLSDMRDQFHRWNNTAQVLTSMVEKLSRTAESAADVSRRNSQGIREVEQLSRSIEQHALSISNNLHLITRDKPLLMRDLFWLETNTAEIGLIALSAGEAVILLVGSEPLLKSAMFRSMSSLIGNPAIWGILVAMLAAGSLASFACRKRSFRTIAAAAQSVYFGVTGLLPLFLTPGVLGWLPHVLAWASATWIVLRGPSDSIR